MDAKKFEADVLAPRVKEYCEITKGHPVRVVIHYNTFNVAGALDYLDTQGLHQLAMAYRTVALMPCGVEALQAVNVIDISYAAAPKVELHGSTLVLQGAFGNSSAIVNDRELSHYLDDHLNIKFRSVKLVLENEQLPALRKEAIEVLGGGDFDWELEWPSFVTAGSIEFVPDVCCHRVLMAFRSIRDAYGTQGHTNLRERIRKARFANTTDPQDRKVFVDGNTLVIHELIDRNYSGEKTDMISNYAIENAIVEALGMKKTLSFGTLKDKQIPDRSKELIEIWGGAGLSYDVDYESFISDTELTFVDNVSCHRVNMALRGLDKKSMEALKKKGLSTVRLRNTTDASKTQLSVEGGVLSMTCNYANGLNGAFSDNAISRALKKYATS